MSIDKSFSFALSLPGASYVKETICRHKHCKHDDRISRRSSIQLQNGRRSGFLDPPIAEQPGRSVRVAALLPISKSCHR
jgi:hypothetical protein